MLLVEDLASCRMKVFDCEFLLSRNASEGFFAEQARNGLNTMRTCGIRLRVLRGSSSVC